MGNLNQIEHRHKRDPWRDVMFIGVAVLLIAVSIGAVSKVSGKPFEKEWKVVVMESNLEINP
jgi:hypothetical protein